MDYYNILGLDRNANADQIKKAYRSKAQQYHPDKNPGDKSAEEQFKKVGDAFEVLSDPQKKQNYDTTGSPNGRGFNFNHSGGPGGFHHEFHFDEMFNNFFGGHPFQHRRRPRIGRTLLYVLNLSLEDTKKILDKALKRNLEIQTSKVEIKT